jgi:Leucine-rich repeat (LRR) protein
MTWAAALRAWRVRGCRRRSSITTPGRGRCPWPLLLAMVVAAAACVRVVAAADLRAIAASSPGCGGGKSNVLSAGLLDGACRVRIPAAGSRGERRFFSFALPPPSSSSSLAARPFSTQLYVSGVGGVGAQQVQMALYKPGSAVPLAERLDGPPDELAAPAFEVAGGGARGSDAFLALGPDAEPGTYVVAVSSPSPGAGAVELRVTTTPSSVRLAEEDRRALSGVAQECCESGEGVFCSAVAPIALASSSSSSFNSDDWRADLCHTAPNACDAEGHLTRLLSLRAAGLSCPMGFPRGLAALPALRELDVSENDFHGQPFNEVERLLPLVEEEGGAPSSPSSSPSFAKLEALRVARSNLAGSLGCVPRLRVLDACGNHLDGPLPGCLLRGGVHGKLTELYLGGNSLSLGVALGAAAASSSSNSSLLVALSLDNQRAGGAVAAAAAEPLEGPPTAVAALLARLPLLRFLDLSGNPGLGPWRLLSDDGANNDDNAVPLPLPPNLDHLNVSATGLEGQLPRRLPKSLSVVDVSDNRKLGGPLPDLSASPRLAAFAATRCAFEGPLPRMSPALRALDVSGNQLSGPTSAAATAALPDALEVLVISDNPGLTGELSQLVGGDVDLVELRAANCSLSGAFPEALARAPNLRMLSVRRNNIGGRLPSDWSGARSLEFLVAGENQIGGSVPASLARVASLRVLRLGFNRLEGTLEAFADALDPDQNRLLDVNVSGNAALRGTVPQALEKLALFDTAGVALQTPPAPLPSGIATPMPSRILALDHTSLSGPFPEWIISAVPPVRAACACRVAVSLNGPSMRLQCPSEAEASSVSDLEWQVASDLGYECSVRRGQRVPLTDVLTSPSVAAAAANRDDAWTVGDGGGVPGGGGSGSARAGAIAGIVIAGLLVATVALGLVGWFYCGGQRRWHERRRGDADGRVGKPMPFHDAAAAKAKDSRGGGAVSVAATAAAAAAGGAQLQSALSTATSQGFLLDPSQAHSNNI